MADPAPRLEPQPVFVRAASHRARRRLFRALGREPRGYWSWDDHATGGFFAITAEELPVARTVTGVTRARPKGRLRPCIDWG